MTALDDYEPPRMVVTIQVRMRSDETLPEFIARLKQQRLWRHGDTVIFLNQQGELDTVRICSPVQQ